MNKQECLEVKRWLYSMPKTDQAILNLEQAIQELQDKLDNPPSHIVSGIGNYSGMNYSGGEEGGSKEQSYVDWKEMCVNRLSFLQEELRKKQIKSRQYRETLELLKKEPKWGHNAGEIIRKKYYDKVKPDTVIYTMFVFCSQREFYRAHRQGLDYFYDVLPNVFLR